MKRTILENSSILRRLEKLTKKLGEALSLTQFCKLNEITLNKSVVTDFQGLVNTLQELATEITNWGENDKAGRDEYDNLKDTQEITLNIFKRYEAQAIFLFAYFEEFLKNYNKSTNTKEERAKLESYISKIGVARNTLMKALKNAVIFWTQQNNRSWNGHLRQYVDLKDKIYLQHFWNGEIAEPEDYDPKYFEALAKDPQVLQKADKVQSIKIGEAA